MLRQAKIIERYTDGNIFEGNWYGNADYYIIGKGEKDGIEYIGKLENVANSEKPYGTIKTLIFNTIKDANTNQLIENNDKVKNGKFKYTYIIGQDSTEYSDPKNWKIQLVPDTPAYRNSMGFGGSKRRRKTRKSRKVKRRTNRRRY